MELFTASIKESPPVQHEWIDSDVHSESRMCGYCEFCWGFDILQNLEIVHESARPHSHILVHHGCIRAIPGFETCTC